MIGGQTRAVFFDFHDTLAVFEPGWAELCVQAATECGVAASAGLEAAARDDEARGSRGWDAYASAEGVDHVVHSTDEAAYRRLLNELTLLRVQAIGVEREAEAVTARLIDLAEEPRHFRLFDDVVPALRALRERGLRLAIVSNHFWPLPEIVEGLGIGGEFEAVVTSARVGYRKPHPRIFEAALDAVGVEAREVLFVGDDAEHDVAGPRRLGMGAVLLDRGAAESGEDRIRSLLELAS